MKRRPPWYRRAVVAYDWAYRRLHGLDAAASEVGPVLRVEVRRAWRTRALGDGTTLRRCSRMGVLHLNNDRVPGLAQAGQLEGTPGLRLRRQMIASLQVLAARCASDGRFAEVQAFSATTIFHRGLRGLGFEESAGGLTSSRLVGIYQRALLTALRRGARPHERPSHREARQLWISRRALLRRYGLADERSPGPGRDQFHR